VLDDLLIINCLWCCCCCDCAAVSKELRRIRGPFGVFLLVVAPARSRSNRLWPASQSFFSKIRFITLKMFYALVCTLCKNALVVERKANARVRLRDVYPGHADMKPKITMSSRTYKFSQVSVLVRSIVVSQEGLENDEFSVSEPCATSVSAASPRGNPS
jgi:hypothetical protein